MLKFKNLKIRTVIIQLIIITVLIFSIENLYSQKDYSEGQARHLLDIGDSLVNIKSYDLAADNYKLAMQYFLSHDLKKFYNSFSKFRKARFKGPHSLSLIKEIKEIAFLINEEEHLLRGKILFYVGYYNGRIGFTNEAVIGYKVALDELNKEEKNTSEANRFLLYSYQNISVSYSRLGDQESAIKYLEIAIELSSKIEGNPRLCSLLLSFSKFLFYNDNYDLVKDKLKQAMEICESRKEFGTIYDFMAEVYIHQDSLVSAKEYLKKSFEIDDEKGALFYEIYANYFIKNNEILQGFIHLEHAIKILKETRKQRIYLKTLMLYAKLQYKNNYKEEALSNAHIALRTYYPELDSINNTDRSKIGYLLPDLWIIEALHIKAKYFREKYLESNDTFSLGEATFYYDLLLSHFDKLKSKYYSSSSQYRMGAYSQEIYSEIISFYVDQYGKYNKREDIENAFSLAQRANSFVLRNAVSDRRALQLAGVAQDSLDQYLWLASNVSSNLESDTTDGAMELKHFDEYKQSLLTNYPSYGKYDKEEEISIEELQSHLNGNELVVKYYYFDEVLTAFGISNDTIFAENISFSKAMDSIINVNLDIISQNVTNDSLARLYLKNSNVVYNKILGNLLVDYNLNSIDHLTIIPDGPLKNISFNALAIDDSGDWNDPSTYLISQQSINYLYYSSQIKNSNSYYEAKNGFIGFGIEYEDDFLNEIVSDYMSNIKADNENSRAISLSPLKYADDEVLTTADILNGESYINTDVTPNQVYSTINDFDIIHFSTHAFVDEDEYLNSFVVLNKDEGDNYQLKYSDILNLDIDSELVVLSACQTGSGKSVVGEGLMSLSRAFVQSGSNAAVGAYWNAPDYATKELMTLFYSNLKEGMPKSKAMQQAQIEYLTNDKISSPTIRSPFFWASWAVYGNDQPLKMSESFFNFNSWEIYALLFALGVLVLLSMRHFSKSKDT